MSNLAVNDQIQAYASQLSGLLGRIPQPRLRQGLLIIVVIWFLSLLADIVWLLVPVPDISAQLAVDELKAASRASGRSAKKTGDVDIRAMQEWHLFGSTVVEVVSDAAGLTGDQLQNASGEAEKTRLQLKLVGVIQSDVSEKSYAIIENQSESALYKVGEKITGENNVTLAGVLADRVILDNRGNKESLFLYDEETQGAREGAEPVSQRPSAGADKTVVDKRQDDRLSEMASNYRNQLIENPMSLADVIKVAVAKDAEGKVIGYRIRPGRDRKQFAEFGLQSGDIVTSINGTPLDDPAKAMELYGQLREAKEASFVVMRGEEVINLIVGLSKQ